MNKKILSIFALIMALSFAVSCSNEETTGTGTGGGNPVDVSLKTPANGQESSTLASEYAPSAFPDIDVNVTGTDAANMVNAASGSKDKILVSVKSVSAVTKSGYKTLSGVQTADVTIKSVTTSPSGSEKVTLSIDGANISGTGSNASKISTDTPATGEKGMLKVELEFKDESGVKTTTPLTVYVTVSNLS